MVTGQRPEACASPAGVAMAPRGLWALRSHLVPLADAGTGDGGPGGCSVTVYNWPLRR
jgi:hypothetical protein